jgi:hypothetical protein
VNKIEKKFYVHCEIEVNAHDESSAASYVKRQMGSSQVVVDIVKRYPSGFFEWQMDQRKETAGNAK